MTDDTPPPNPNAEREQISGGLKFVIELGPIAAFFIGQINPRSVFTPAAAAASLTLVAHVVSQGVLLATGRQLPILDLLLSVTLPTMLYNGVVMIPVYRLIGAFYLAGRPRRVEGLS